MRRLRRFPNMKSTVATLLQSLPATTGVLAVIIFVWLMLGILGVQTLGGKLRRCSDPTRDRTDCVLHGGELLPADFNFDNLGNAILTLLSLFSLNHWAGEMWSAIDQADSGEEYGIAALFVSFVFFGNVLVTSLYTAVIVNEYQQQHYAFLTEAQERWVKAKRTKAMLEQNRQNRELTRAQIKGSNIGSLDGLRMRLTWALQSRAFLPSHRGMEHASLQSGAADDTLTLLHALRDSQTSYIQDGCWRIIHGTPPHQLWETFVCGLLASNCLFAMMYHSSQPGQPYPAQELVSSSTRVFLAAEIVVKISAYGVLGYVVDPSDRSDGAFATLGVAGLWFETYPADWMDSTTQKFLGHTPPLLMLYRILRLFSRWRFFRRLLRPLRTLLNTLQFSLPALLNVLLLMVLILYIYALLGVILFKELPVGHGAINDRANFSNLLISMLTTLRVVTGDGWSPLLAACMQSDNPKSFAVVYFGSFVFLNFFLVNLLCAVLLLQGIRSFYGEGLASMERLLVLLEAKRRLMAPVIRMRERRQVGGNLVGIFVEDKVVQDEHPWVSKLIKVVPDNRHKRPSSRQSVDPLKADLESRLRAEATRQRVNYVDVPTLLEPLFKHAVWECAKTTGASTRTVGGGVQGQPMARPLALKRVSTLLDAYAAELCLTNPRWRVTGDTALHVAAFMGDAQLTQLLIAHGFDTRALNSSANEALNALGFGSSESSGIERKVADIRLIASASTPVHFAGRSRDSNSRLADTSN